MSSELLTTTNKARVWRNSDGTVTKEYFDAERARGEYGNLRELTSIVGGGRDVDGWSYRSVPVLGFDGESARVRMGFVPGASLADLLVKDRSAGRHMGVWLALFHLNAGAGRESVHLYSDVSIHNFLVDVPGRVVTAIDPGLDFGRTGDPQVDVLMGASSLLNHAIKIRTRPGRLVRPYLYGYQATVGTLRVAGGSFDAAVDAVVQRFHTKQARLGLLLRPLFGVKLFWLERYLRRRLPRLLDS